VPHESDQGTKHINENIKENINNGFIPKSPNVSHELDQGTNWGFGGNRLNVFKIIQGQLGPLLKKSRLDKTYKHENIKENINKGFIPKSPNVSHELDQGTNWGFGGKRLKVFKRIQGQLGPLLKKKVSQTKHINKNIKENINKGFIPKSPNVSHELDQGTNWGFGGKRLKVFKRIQGQLGPSLRYPCRNKRRQF
jgi:hypothetical protein